MEKKYKKGTKANPDNKVLDDKKINIMLLGASGSGKSTLINAFIDTALERAPVGIGKAKTDTIAVYGEASNLPFRLIDTPGLEYNKKKQAWLIKELKKWMKNSVKNQDPKTMIHTIWFCVPSTYKRLPKEVLDYMHIVSQFWEHVPIIFVSTQAFFSEDESENEQMINEVIEEYGRDKLNIKAIIPVLAEKKAGIEPRGLAELKEATEQLGPEARKIFERNWKEKRCWGKRMEANKVVVGRVVLAMTADVVKKGSVSAIVSGIQAEMLSKVADIYEIEDDNTIKTIASALISSSAISTLGKKLADRAVLLARGKVKLAGKAVTAAISGAMTLTLGEIGITVYESIYKGDLDIENTNWNIYVEKILKDKSFINRLKSLKSALKKKDGDVIIDELVELLQSDSNSKE